MYNGPKVISGHVADWLIQLEIELKKYIPADDLISLETRIKHVIDRFWEEMVKKNQAVPVIPEPIVTNEDIIAAESALNAANKEHGFLAEAVYNAVVNVAAANDDVAAAQSLVNAATCVISKVSKDVDDFKNATNAAIEIMRALADKACADPTRWSIGGGAIVAIDQVAAHEKKLFQGRLTLAHAQNALCDAQAKLDQAQTVANTAKEANIVANQAAADSQLKVETAKKKYDELTLKANQQKVGMFDPDLYIEADGIAVETCLADRYKMRSAATADGAFKQCLKVVEKYKGDQLVKCFLISDVLYHGGV